MVEGRGEFEWARTSWILATYINSNRKKGSRPVKPEDLNPYLDTGAGREKKVNLTQHETVEVLRKVFTNGK